MRKWLMSLPNIFFKIAPPALQFNELLAVHFAFLEYGDNRYFLSYVVKKG